MRTHASIFPPPARPARRIDPRLLQVLAHAMAALGDIELPDSAPTADDVQRLQLIAPLYLAHELEQAGLLRTAELIAGLFASGAIPQPLGPPAQLIADFWRTRRQRLSAPEREQLFAQLFDPPGFYPLMQALCDALAGQFDNPARSADIQGQVALQEAADTLGAWLAPRAVGMAGFAGPEIVQALVQATQFLRDRLLQTAFGVQDLWGLLNTVGSPQGAGAVEIRRRVELGRQGTIVLEWLAGAVAAGDPFEPASPGGRQRMAAAKAWRMAWAGLQGGAPAQRGARSSLVLA